MLALPFTTSPSLNRDLQLSEHALRLLATDGAEEIDGNHLGEALAQASHLRATLREHLGLCVAAQRLRHGTCVLGHVVVVGVARPVEKGPDILIRNAVDQACLTDHRFTAALDDLSHQPLEILLGLLVHRQRMHRVLDRDRAEVLQPPPDLDAEICRLRRKLMDEQEPAVDQRRMGSGIHGIDVVSSYWS